MLASKLTMIIILLHTDINCLVQSMPFSLGFTSFIFGIWQLGCHYISKTLNNLVIRVIQFDLISLIIGLFISSPNSENCI